tara:strand:- start:3729 stop:3875 length:147 start_codon:yes stop_codon:yes gene_type:complete
VLDEAKLDSEYVVLVAIAGTAVASLVLSIVVLVQALKLQIIASNTKNS